MKRLLLLIAAAAFAFPCAAGAQTAAETAALVAPVTAWGDAFNAAQVDFPKGAFTEDCTVIDEFPPFSWTGAPENVRAWYAELVGGDGTKRHAQFLASKQHVTFDAPRFVRIRNDGAYLVFPSSLSYFSQGATHVQRGTYVVVERKTADGWRISANAWAIDSDD